MKRRMHLPAARLFKVWLLSCSGMLLVGLLVMFLTWPGAGLAEAAPGLPTASPTLRFTPTATHRPSPTATTTPRPKPTATATPRPTATATPPSAATATPQPAATATLPPVPSATPALVLATSASATPPGAKPSPTTHAGAAGGGKKGVLAAAPSWLVEGLAAVFLILLAFTLIVFPLAMRSARAERRSRPSGRVPRSGGVDSQVARLNEIPPARREPLTREQMLAVRNSQKLPAVSRVSNQSMGSLAAIRLVNGVPISLPITEAETAPQLPAARWPAAGKVVEGSTGELPVVQPNQIPAREAEEQPW